MAWVEAVNLKGQDAEGPDILVLNEGDDVPGGTAVGTIIVRIPA